MKLYTYNALGDVYKVVAPNRNTANLMLNIYCFENGTKPGIYACTVEDVVVQISEHEAWRRYHECAHIEGDEVDRIKD